MGKKREKQIGTLSHTLSHSLASSSSAREFLCGLCHTLLKAEQSMQLLLLMVIMASELGWVFLTHTTGATCTAELLANALDVSTSLHTLRGKGHDDTCTWCVSLL